MRQIKETFILCIHFMHFVHKKLKKKLLKSKSVARSLLHVIVNCGSIDKCHCFKFEFT
jgi:hypothetical protein